MPPPGGYANLPWRRNIPTRGFGFVGCLVFGSLYYFFSDVNNRTRRGQWRREMKLEAENLDMACMPLYEAVNIVASCFDPTWKCGGYGIGDNGNGAYWPS